MRVSNSRPSPYERDVITTTPRVRAKVFARRHIYRRSNLKAFNSDDILDPREVEGKYFIILYIPYIEKN